MSIGGVSNNESSWRTFLMDAELTKNYKIVNMFNGGHLPAPNPILEKLLPSLLYVRLGALLDETFEDYIDSNGLVVTKPYRNDFNGRISFLNDQGRLYDAGKLHALRLKRNGLAHDASNSCNWAELEEAISVADQELQHLGLIGPRPKYEFYAERNPREKADPGYMVTFDYRYGLKVDGNRTIEVSWAASYGG